MVSTPYKPSLWNSGERRSSCGITPNPTFLGPHALVLRGRMVLTGGLGRAAAGAGLEKDPGQEDGMSSHKVWFPHGHQLSTSWILIGVFILDMSERSVPHFKGHGQCLSTYTTGLVPTVL